MVRGILALSVRPLRGRLERRGAEGEESGSGGSWAVSLILLLGLREGLSSSVVVGDTLGGRELFPSREEMDDAGWSDLSTGDNSDIRSIGSAEERQGES